MESSEESSSSASSSKGRCSGSKKRPADKVKKSKGSTKDNNSRAVKDSGNISGRRSDQDTGRRWTSRQKDERKESRHLQSQRHRRSTNARSADTESGTEIKVQLKDFLSAVMASVRQKDNVQNTSKVKMNEKIGHMDGAEHGGRSDEHEKTPKDATDDVTEHRESHGRSEQLISPSLETFTEQHSGRNEGERSEEMLVDTESNVNSQSDSEMHHPGSGTVSPKSAADVAADEEILSTLAPEFYFAADKGCKSRKQNRSLGENSPENHDSSGSTPECTYETMEKIFNEARLAIQCPDNNSSGSLETVQEEDEDPIHRTPEEGRMSRNSQESLVRSVTESDTGGIADSLADELNIVKENGKEMKNNRSRSDDSLESLWDSLSSSKGAASGSGLVGGHGKKEKLRRRLFSADNGSKSSHHSPKTHKEMAAVSDRSDGSAAARKRDKNADKSVASSRSRSSSGSENCFPYERLEDDGQRRPVEETVLAGGPQSPDNECGDDHVSTRGLIFSSPEPIVVQRAKSQKENTSIMASETKQIATERHWPQEVSGQKMSVTPGCSQIGGGGLRFFCMIFTGHFTFYILCEFVHQVFG